MDSAVTYETGTLVWCLDPNPSGVAAYISCSVTSCDTANITLKATSIEGDDNTDDNGISWLEDIYDDDAITVPVVDASTRIFPQNPPMSPSSPPVHDLTNLPFLNPATLLHALHSRYRQDVIYTATGPILIAINPFQPLPLYSSRTIDVYRSAGVTQQFLPSEITLPPHIFKTTDAAYRQMLSTRTSQSLLISGESGAGKTETTKHALAYLTSISGGDAHTKGGDATPNNIIPALLAATPLLESIGNAKTNRNDNSSRFGLLRTLCFKKSSLTSASISTYLLEAIRVTHHVPGERNFHILYLIATLPNSVTGLHRYAQPNHTTVTKSLRYLNLGGVPSSDFNVTYENLCTSLERILVDPNPLVQFLAVILHLGQISFMAAQSNDENNVDKFIVDDANGVLGEICKLSNIPPETLEATLTSRTMTTRGETFVISNNQAQCITARDAIARRMYKMLFDYLVDKINKSIDIENSADAPPPAPKEARTEINVLDIFGFESFATNTFEQLCINYTNECLQEQFNRHVFQQQQQEYIREGIKYEEVTFKSNQYIIDVISSSTGILGLLDDECKLPKGDDGKWARKMTQHFLDKSGTNPNDVFKASARQRRDGTFVVTHFAGNVEYTSDGFVEKNKDSVLADVDNLWGEGSKCSAFFQEVLRDDAAASSTSSGRTTLATISGKFKKSLDALLKKISMTGPHYVRCLKPNDEAKPSLLIRSRVTEQLRYGGVLEAVRVCREGYAVKFTHEEFSDRYSPLFSRNNNGESTENLVEQLTNPSSSTQVQLTFGSSSEKIASSLPSTPPPPHFTELEIQQGKTKVFMKTHVHNTLELQVSFKNSIAAILVQNVTRRFLCFRLYMFFQYRLRLVQRWWRGEKDRKYAQGLREHKAAVLLGKFARKSVARRRYIVLRRGVKASQFNWRRRTKRRSRAAVKVQTTYRRWYYEGVYWGLIKCMTTLQNKWRTVLAKRTRKLRAAEGRDINKLAEEKERMKQEMVALKSMLKVQQKGLAREKLLKEEEEETRMWKAKCAKLERDLEAATSAAAMPSTPALKKSGSSDSPARQGYGGNKADAVIAIESLQIELNDERARRVAAEREVIMLRAKINGVDLTQDEIDNLISEDTTSSVASPKPKPRSAARIELRRSSSVSITVNKKEMILNSQKLVEEEAKKIGMVWKDNWDDDEASDEDPDEEVSRMQKTLKLRDEVRRFEQKMERFTSDFQEGIDLVLWQVNKNSIIDDDDEDEFAVHSQPVTARLDTRGCEGLLTASIKFQSRKGFIKSRSVFGVLAGKFGKENEVTNGGLFLHEILDIRAGVSVGSVGATKERSVADFVKNKEFQNTGLFLTIVAVATPATPQRVLLLKFNSRVERNDCLSGLRKVLADVQILNAQTQKGGVAGAMSPFRNHSNGSHSIFRKNKGDKDAVGGTVLGGEEVKVYGSGGEGGAKTMVLLSDVHRQLSKERSSYERVMVQMLQSTLDLQEKEDEMAGLIEALVKERKKNRRNSGGRGWWGSGGGAEGKNDRGEEESIVLSLSRKLEELLIDNEDLRDKLKKKGTQGGETVEGSDSFGTI